MIMTDSTVLLWTMVLAVVQLVGYVWLLMGYRWENWTLFFAGLLTIVGSLFGYGGSSIVGMITGVLSSSS